MLPNAIVLLSGGLDSTTLLYDTLHRNQHDHVTALSFDYGQRHKKELDCAQAITEALGIAHTIFDLPNWAYASDSALTNPNVPVPEGHYEAPNMRITVVPNRNAIMLNLAVGYAMSIGASDIFTAVHAGDRAIYPDCRPEFIDAINILVSVANEGFKYPRVRAPFLYWAKERIAREAAYLAVPIEMTWSCYQGGTLHCGKCGTCSERIEAFQLAGVEDPTHYA